MTAPVVGEDHDNRTWRPALQDSCDRLGAIGCILSGENGANIQQIASQEMKERFTHDNLELKQGTPGKFPEGPSPECLYLQDHGNPVVFRNIWIEE